MKSSPYFWLALHRTKVRWRFRKILWPSQNIWTLYQYLFIHLSSFSDWPLVYPLKTLIFYTLNTPLSSSQLHLHIFLAQNILLLLKLHSCILNLILPFQWRTEGKHFCLFNAFDFIYCICTCEGWNFVNWELFIQFPLGFVTWL